MSTGQSRQVAREGLLRMKPFELERAGNSDGTDGLTLSGHAAVFDARTVIDSWEGRFVEEIAAGAFKKTFRERTPVMQFDHGHHPLVGSIPIGRYQDVHEDDRGAFSSGRLHDNWLVQPVRDAIAEGSITGMSFRFSVVKEEWRDGEGNLIRDEETLLRLLWSESSEEPVRTLRELKVPEMGPVVFPAYDETDVGVRSNRTVIDLGELRKNPEARKSLGRMLFLAETATVGDDTERTEPQAGEPHSGREGDEPLQEQHSAEQHSDTTPSEPTRSVADMAAEMRERLTRLTTEG